MDFKLFCTVTNETYYVKANSVEEAKHSLALQIGCPISTLEVWM